MPNSVQSRIKVLLVSEDNEYSHCLTEFAAAAGIDVITMQTLSELGSIGYLGQCDVLLVDSQLGPLQGRDVAEYAAAFFPGLPVLIAAKGPEATGLAAPQVAGGFFCKNSPLADVVSLVANLGRESLINKNQPLTAARDSIAHAGQLDT